MKSLEINKYGKIAYEMEINKSGCSVCAVRTKCFAEFALMFYEPSSSKNKDDLAKYNFHRSNAKSVKKKLDEYIEAKK